MWEALQTFSWRDAFDILLLAAVLCWVVFRIRGARAAPLVLGLVLLGGAMLIARRYSLFGTGSFLDNVWAFWVLVLVVIFQPELRRALGRVGRSRFLKGVLGASSREQRHVIDDVVEAVHALAAKRIGALVVLERGTGLRQYAELGVPLDALVSSDLLESLFHPYSPLHDGAVVIQGPRIVAAGVFLPLSRNPQLGRKLGTRHRAALGLSEETDAVVLVASEESGRISLAVDGQTESLFDQTALRHRLAELLTGGGAAERASFRERLARWRGAWSKAERHGRA